VGALSVGGVANMLDVKKKNIRIPGNLGEFVLAAVTGSLYGGFDTVKLEFA